MSVELDSTEVIEILWSGTMLDKDVVAGMHTAIDYLEHNLGVFDDIDAAYWHKSIDADVTDGFLNYFWDDFNDELQDFSLGVMTSPDDPAEGWLVRF